MLRIVTAYTPNYKHLADRLVASAKFYDAPITPVAFDDLGSWAKNNNFKPVAVLDTMIRTGDDCLWLDADMSLREWPTSWPEGDILIHYAGSPESKVFDFATRRVVENKERHRTPFGGHILFRNRPLVRTLLKSWKVLCGQYAGITNDEQCLMRALGMLLDTISIGPLDVGFIIHRPEGRCHGKPRGWL